MKEVFALTFSLHTMLPFLEGLPCGIFIAIGKCLRFDPSHV